MECLPNIHRASTEHRELGCTCLGLGMFRLDLVGHVEALWAGCNQAFRGWPCAVLRGVSGGKAKVSALPPRSVIPCLGGGWWPMMGIYTHLVGYPRSETMHPSQKQKHESASVFTKQEVMPQALHRSRQLPITPLISRTHRKMSRPMTMKIQGLRCQAKKRT